MIEDQNNDKQSEADNRAKMYVSRSALYKAFLAELSRITEAVYCRLDRGEVEDWCNEAKEKISIFQKLNYDS
jgi:hypothetical protein